MSEKFDEAYYQTGGQRGTQYRNYLEEAPRNRTYFEIAELIVKVFKPRRTLEIGCATGTVVSHLATFDIDAYGVDVSEWAVEHRLHPNVSLGNVEQLQFDDNSFDLVYSCHALEHIPSGSQKQAFQELSRVCRGMQFHMMPMLESGPYVGDRFGHLLNLRTDPTHSLLYEREWWLNEFKQVGFLDTGVKVALVHDNLHFELSDCQVVVARQEVDAAFLREASARNLSVAKTLSLALNGKPGPGLEIHIARLKA